VNDLQKNGIRVFRVAGETTGNNPITPGSFYIPYSESAKDLLSRSASLQGVRVSIINRTPSNTEKITPARIAIVNRYGGSMPAGWISWIVEQFHFSYSMVYTQNIDSGDLRKRFDVILFASDIVPRMRRNSDTAVMKQPVSVNEDIPSGFRGMTGVLTAQGSVPQIRKFLEDGGVVITIGPSTSLAYDLDLPVKNALVRRGDNNNDLPLKNTEFYIPGSLLGTEVDTTIREGWGMRAHCDTYFDGDPLFRLDKDATEKGVKKILWYSGEASLHSGWALGQKYLKDGVAAFVAALGNGRFYAFTPEITFRSQSHSTFKLLFNELYVVQTGKSKADKGKK
jgi:hypothetical protein